MQLVTRRVMVDEDRSPLHRSITPGLILVVAQATEYISVLLEHGADPLRMDARWRTAADLDHERRLPILHPAAKALEMLRGGLANLRDFDSDDSDEERGSDDDALDALLEGDEDGAPRASGACSPSSNRHIVVAMTVTPLAAGRAPVLFHRRETWADAPRDGASHRWFPRRSSMIWWHYSTIFDGCSTICSTISSTVDLFYG